MASLLTTFLAAFILAYVLRPVFTCFLALRAGKTLSAALTVLIGFLGILGLILLFISVLQKELPALRQQLPIWLDLAQRSLQPWLDNLAINFDLKKIQEIIQSRISEQLSNNADAIISSSLSTILSSGQSILGSLFGLVLIVFIVFYLVGQWDEFFKKLNPLIPPRWLPLVKQILVEIDQLLSQYLRGQLLVITILSIYYSVGLYLLGITGALALGLFTGIAIFIPYIGYGVALILALLSGLLQAETGGSLLAVLALYIAGQTIESFVLTPKLVGEKIGLHPVLVVFALILFGSWFGFFGILLALPISAIILVLCKHAMQAYQDSAWYKNND
ncbi:MAG: AI-2E family transporter [Polynucleobacter victoriensis]